MTTRRKWYNPEVDDPKSRHFTTRTPMDRRAIRYIIRCPNCEALNDITHGMAHAAPLFEIPCNVCEQLLPKRDVIHATRGRQNPLNIP